MQHLSLHRIGLQCDVHERYKVLRNKGVEDETARNIAAAQAALSGKTRPRARAAVYRRELDAILSPKPSRTERVPDPDPEPTKPKGKKTSHWTLPL